jgi:hypothetical protein
MGLLRLGIGGWAAARPGRVAEGVGVSPDQRELAVPYVRALAARELVLGVGTIVAVRRGHSGAGWLAAMALSEAFDAAVYEILAELGTLEASRARRSSVLALTGTVAESVMALAVARSHR